MFMKTQQLHNEIADQIEATTDVAKTGTGPDLLESVEDLQALLNQGTVAGLKCDGPQIKAKFATLQEALNARTRA